jgi:hypothetical protein
MVLNSGLIMHVTKGFILMGKSMEKVNLTLLMDLFTMGNFITTIFKVLVPTIGQIKGFMWVNGNITRCMVVE